MYKSYKNLLLTLIILLCSCTAMPIGNSISNLPGWYISPKQNDVVNLYGVGEGFTLGEARNAALKNLAAKLKVTISSKTTAILEENKFAVNEEFRQKVNETVDEMTFNNYQVTNTAQIGNKIYAQIAVDRDNFIRDRKGKLAILNKQMGIFYKNSKNTTILTKRNNLANIVDLSIEAQSIIDILTGINSIAYNIREKNIKKYNFYHKAYNQILYKIEFFIKSNQTPKSVTDVIISALNEKNFVIAKSQDSQNNNLVTINIKSNIVRKKVYNSNIAKLKVNFSLLSNRNKILAGNKLEVTGNSMVSGKEAVNAAAFELSKKINSEGILKILGINN